MTNQVIRINNQKDKKNNITVKNTSVSIAPVSGKVPFKKSAGKHLKSLIVTSLFIAPGRKWD